jgi:hypothetical protein
MLIFLSMMLLFLAMPFLGGSLATWILSCAQLVLLIDQWRRRQVSGEAGFVFMSFLFFGVRPIYLVLESDYSLLVDLFQVQVGLWEVNESMWWATLGLLAFCSGAALLRMSKQSKNGEVKRRENQPTQLVSANMVNGMLLYQIISLPIMLMLARSGRSLYGSSMGAYVYDLPVPLQSGHIVAIVVILERYLKDKRSTRLVQLLLSGTLFLYFTWLMREVSIFRGFYIAGIMIAGIAVLSRLKKRVSLAWLILPIVLIQPIFRALGEQRQMSNEEIRQQSVIEMAFGKASPIGAYWRFYDSGGDMNIFDTFVAAREANVAYRPYILSWIYVPFHFIPRSLWKSKPAHGCLQDVSFTNGAPYCPGIAGFFVLDGGDMWMVGSMFVLGLLLAWLDQRILFLQRGYLRSCLIGIVSVNAMFLTRFFLWQYFYQLVYAIVPCLALAWLFRRKNKSRKHDGQVPDSDNVDDGWSVTPAVQIASGRFVNLSTRLVDVKASL